MRLKTCEQAIGSRRKRRSALASHQELLPQGIQTENNYLFRIQLEENGEKIGMTWMKHEALRAHGECRVFELFGFSRRSLRSLLKKLANHISTNTVQAKKPHVNFRMRLF